MQRKSKVVAGDRFLKEKLKYCKMKPLIKGFFALCVIMTFPTFILKMFHVRPRRIQEIETKPIESTSNLMTVDSDCMKRFRRPVLRKRLLRALASGDPDTFMTIMQKYLPMCKLQQTGYKSYGFGLIEPEISETPAPEKHNKSSTVTTEDEWHSSSTLKYLCPRRSPRLRGHIQVDTPEKSDIRKIDGKYFNWPMTLEELAVLYRRLQLGGFHPGPSECRCRGFNAIIVPFRDREEHLRYFLYYIHQLLQRQQLCYIVIVSEQDDDRVFNKGQLMNTAFKYARNLMPFDCYIFHDVDVIAEDDRILYTCKDDQIMHYAPYIDKYNYKFEKNGLTVGAAVGFTEEQFLSVNGYSNEYAGWGGEDDDMADRISMRKIPVWRSMANYTKFRMIKHGSDPGNEINKHRYQRLKHTKARQGFDGINSLDTLLMDNIQYKTHTRLKVKTYMTGLQKELEKTDPNEEQKYVKLYVGIPLAKRKGTAIYAPGTILRVKKQQ